MYKSHFRHFAGKLLSRWEGPYIIEKVHHSKAIKIDNDEGDKPKVDNGQRLKYSTLGNPINIDSDLIQVIILEECIEETIHEASRTP